MLSTASQPSRQRTHSCRVRLSLRMNTAVPGAASGYRSFSCRSAERRGGRQVARRTVSPVAFHLVLKGGQSHTIMWVFQFRSVNKKVFFFTRYWYKVADLLESISFSSSESIQETDTDPRCDTVQNNKVETVLM